MVNYFSLRVFLICLLVCAAMTISSIWLEGKVLVPAYFQTTATLFIIGLASFLIWFSRMILEIRNSLRR